MRRIWRSILVLAVALVIGVGPLALWDGAATPAQAGGSWSAWLYNSGNGQLVHVFPDGAPAMTMAVPLPPGVTDPPSALTISRDGRYLAACYYDAGYNPTIRVYDLVALAWLATYTPSGQIQGCGLTRYSFGPDSSLLAFGLLNHWPDPADPRPEWELIVMDINTGAVVHQLSSALPTLASLGRSYTGVVPFVEAFDERVIAFRPVNWGTEGLCEYDGLVWQLDGTNQVNFSAPYGKNRLDLLLPNGELVWIETDESLPKGTLMGPGCEHNVVIYSNKAGACHAVFHNGTVLTNARFVDGGRKVAIGSFNGTVTEWFYLDRGGATGGLPADLREVWDLWGTPDGYVFLRQAGASPPQVIYHRFDTSPTIPQATVAWTGASGEFWNIVWVNPLTEGSGLPPFPAISPAPAPVTPPPAPGTPVVGGQVRVNTTAGDLLRVRTGPGLGFTILTQLPNGEVVTVTDGPRTADGLTWWQVETPLGPGWAVEGVMDGGTFLQTLIPVP